MNGPPSPESLVGRRLPGGTLVIAPTDDAALRGILGSAAGPAGEAHPLFGFIGAMRGMGIDWHGFFALCGASADDGPMMGETDLDLRRPLATGQAYAVTATIVGFVRKEGRRTGPFDVVTLQVDIADESGPVAVLRQSIILPRAAR
ncbi:hypothetical protein [uncultured Alsobacter sp.]|uniref:hypothetical protein n=1 Tax=uncultured Alsobacter sp. TaxID=1748258 RepID=UPI0025DAFC8B|nr:hypothetical protein [uncultured Alsobacter sp.]